MKRSLALFYVAGLFLLGILIGALGMHLYHAANPPQRPDFGQRGQGRFSEMFRERLERMLDLTPEQARQIETIMDEAREEGQSIHEELLPKVRTHMEQVRERIMEVLTPEQQKKFEEMQRSHRGRFERMLLGPPPPFRGGP